MEIKEKIFKLRQFWYTICWKFTNSSFNIKQLKLGKYLVEELQSLGIENAKIDEYGVVYGTIS